MLFCFVAVLVVVLVLIFFFLGGGVGDANGVVGIGE